MGRGGKHREPFYHLTLWTSATSHLTCPRHRITPYIKKKRKLETVSEANRRVGTRNTSDFAFESSTFFFLVWIYVLLCFDSLLIPSATTIPPEQPERHWHLRQREGETNPHSQFLPQSQTQDDRSGPQWRSGEQDRNTNWEGEVQIYNKWERELAQSPWKGKQAAFSTILNAFIFFYESKRSTSDEIAAELTLTSQPKTGRILYSISLREASAQTLKLTSQCS